MVEVEEKRKRIVVVNRSGVRETLEVIRGRDAFSGFPEGTLESLYPIMQRVLVEYPQISSPEPGFWINLEERAHFSYEKAVNLARRRGKSAEDTGAAVVNGILSLAGLKHEDIGEQILSQMVSQATEKIKEIYVATTQVSPRK